MRKRAVRVKIDVFYLIIFKLFFGVSVGQLAIRNLQVVARFKDTFFGNIGDMEAMQAFFGEILNMVIREIASRHVSPRQGLDKRVLILGMLHVSGIVIVVSDDAVRTISRYDHAKDDTKKHYANLSFCFNDLFPPEKCRLEKERAKFAVLILAVPSAAISVDRILKLFLI